MPDRLEGDRELVVAELAGMVNAELPQLRATCDARSRPAMPTRCDGAHSLVGMAGNLSHVALQTLGRSWAGGRGWRWALAGLLVERCRRVSIALRPVSHLKGESGATVNGM